MQAAMLQLRAECARASLASAGGSTNPNAEQVGEGQLPPSATSILTLQDRTCRPSGRSTS
jgi:hypothetical protein